MGVLFFAGRGLTKLDNVPLLENVNCDDLTDDDCDESLDEIFVEGNSEVPQLAEGVEVGAFYRCAETMFISFPHWRVCRAWVEKLWDMIGCSEDEVLAEGSTVAFREFFLWAQRGTVGPKASARLAAQFSDWDARAKAFADEQFYEIYGHKRAMFEWCAQDGLLFLQST